MRKHARNALFRALLLAVLVGVASIPAVAQTYPDKPIRILVGGAPGSVPDAMIRPIAERLAVELGKPVVVENKPGAAGIVAMEALTRSAPDGYTLAVATMSQAVFNAYLFAKLPYDPQRDLVPVAPLVSGSLALAANPAYPANSLRELVQLARGGPTKPFVAMPQTGSPPHVVALLLQRAAGIEFAMVPYKSGTEAVAAVIAGELPLVIEAPTSVAPQVHAGKLKALVVTGHEREPSLPDTLTVAESGFPELAVEAWIGLVSPRDTPDSIVALLNRALAKVLATPAVKERLATLGFRTQTSSSADFGRLMVAERAKWSAVIQSANLKLN